MYEKLEECPICSNKRFDNYLICDDHSVSKESFALVKCTKCSLILTNPRPKEESIGQYYESDEYISHTDSANTLTNFLYKIVRSYTLRKKATLIKRKNKGIGKVLDYGCGTGDFLMKCKKDGWEVEGVEPDDKARKLAQQKSDIPLHSNLATLDENFDIITAWHVVEHISDLANTIKSLKKKLKDGGYFIIALPNHQSLDAQIYKENWAAYDVPRHLYHFDRSSMKHFAKRFKLKVKDVLPMKFDSYYVSMLSEKYKNGSIISAIKSGFKSNRSAAKTGEYSSLIYILKK